ncbi:phosphatidylinositol 4-kinase type 2-alpha [Acrasis kona]|uniref:Phosphatidylinositol 4-kinase type 2-alpha n=1 Tax=Acrasis kona TaxID=1008807 RepID=A0AAW2ZH60_9EUKA
MDGEKTNELPLKGFKFLLTNVNKTDDFKEEISSNGGDVCGEAEDANYVVVGKRKQTKATEDAKKHQVDLVTVKFVRSWIESGKKPNPKDYTPDIPILKQTNPKKTTQIVDDSSLEPTTPKKTTQSIPIQQTPGSGSFLPPMDPKNFNLKFVNRETVAGELAAFFLGNKDKNLSEKKYARLAQPFGAGKTEFTARFREVITDEGWRKLEEVYGKDEVASFKKANYLKLDFRQFGAVLESDGSKPSLFVYLRKNLESALKKCGLYTDESDMSHIKTPCIVCMDEVSKIHYPGITSYLNNECASSRNVRNLHLNEFIQHVHRVCGCFVFKITASPVAESVDIIEDDELMKQSNDTEITFFLSPLRGVHVVEILEETKINNISIYQHLTDITVDGDVDDFASLFVVYTAGCPRVVKDCINFLINQKCKLDNQSDREKWISLSKVMVKRKDLVPIIHENERPLYYALLLSAHFQYKFPEDSVYNFAGTDKNLAYWMSKYNLYFDRVEVDGQFFIQIVVGRLTLEILVNDACFSSYLNNLVSSWKYDETTDKGAIFEKLTKTALINQITLACFNLTTDNNKWKDISNGIFRDCFFGDYKVTLSEKPVKLTNGFSGSVSGIKDHRLDTWEHNLPTHPDSYVHLCKKLFTSNTIYQPAKRSSSWDFCLL